MSNITKIEGSSCQRYSNALHVGFHQHILVIFETLLSDVLAKLHISVDLLNSYKKSIDQESELNRKSFARTLYFQCCYKSRKYFTISNLFYTNIFTINIFLLFFSYIWHEAELLKMNRSFRRAIRLCFTR